MPVTPDSYDLRLTVDGVEYGLLLAEQDGIKQLNDGLAPFITPQFRTEAFGYDHTPPEIEVPMAVESWEMGAGFDLSNTGGGVSTITYAYSQGVDLSHNDRAFLSPLQQTALTSLGTAIAAAPVRFIDTSLGFFMLAGAYIYEFDSSTSSTAKWILRNDASSDGQAYKDMVELDGILYASRGASADYKYSSDGVTWTAFTDADENADYFVTRGNGSDIASVWKVLANLVKNTPNGANGGTSWSGADEVGHTSETTTGMICVNNDIYVFKKEGIYVYDGTTTQDLWKTKYFLANNGRNPFQWVDGNIYVPYGRRLIQIDPLSEATTLIPIFPNDLTDSVELKGDITAIGGDDYNLFFAVKNRAGNTYIMKGKPGKGWHTILYLGANDCNALYVVPPGVIHSTQPALVIGYGTAAPYYLLAREDMHPGDDPNYRFSTSEGVAYGSYFNFGAKTYSKFLNHGSVLGDNISGGRPVTLAYQVDRTATITDLVTATSNGLTDTDEANEVAFNQLRYALYMETGDESASPAVDSLALFATLNPERKRMWVPTVVLSDDLPLPGGVRTDQAPSAQKVREVLFGAVNKRLTLIDEYSNSYTVRLLNITPSGKVSKRIGGKEYATFGYQLQLVEVNTLTTNETVGVYDSSTYDSGHVYA
jgi:hypothetical protein